MTTPNLADIIILEKRGKCDKLERLLLNDLFLWKNKRNRRPLILTGSRQTGKTWLLKEFSNSYFEDSLYIDLKKNPKVISLFDDSVTPRRTMEILGALFGKLIEPYRTLLILDNIHKLPNFEKVLTRFSEDASQYLICCATNHQNILDETNSFLVLNLNPLNFEEFLLANGEAGLIDFFKSGALTDIPKLIENKLLDQLKLYFIIGGMPSSVNTWIETRDFIEVEQTLSAILELYKEDINSSLDTVLIPKINSVWQSIPKQLAKDNRKFMYGSVRPGARAREYQEALDWLLSNAYGTSVFAIKDAASIESLELPLFDKKSFRVFFPDVALLRLAYQIPYSIIKFQDKIFRDYNCALTLQFVFQELVGKFSSNNINYWTSGATAEIDFIFQYNQHRYPFEININDNLKARSIRIYQERFAPKRMIRTSISSLRIKDSFINIPLHLLFNLENYLLNYL